MPRRSPGLPGRWHARGRRGGPRCRGSARRGRPGRALGSELLRLALGRDLDHVPGQAAAAASPGSPQADGSISHQRRPCAAERGKAWWLWCHASPKESSASQKTLVEWSSTSKRRVPKKWQTELIDHVTWCSRKMRTRPPHSRPVSAAGERAVDQRSRARTGSARPASDDQREGAVDRAHAAVLDQVAGVALRARPGPRGRTASPCARTRARAARRAGRRRAACGECGSPSSSVWAWCLRWSATHDDRRGPAPTSSPAREQVLDRLVGLEGAMGEQAVEAESPRSR